MKSIVQRSERNHLAPFTRDPKEEQVAALCYRGKGKKRRILLITSRDTGRWVLPKGWPVEGLDGPGSAAQEAWEEAGVRPAKIKARAIGIFEYGKRLDNGVRVPVEITVYRIKVDSLAATFPEAKERIRKWVTPSEAADMVDEPGLKELLRNF